MKLLTLLKEPSAYAPPSMSAAALAIVLIHLARYGVTRETDEGTSAHLFQLLLAAQLPIVAWFAIKWLPREPGRALVVLAMQAAAGLAALAPIFILEW